MNIIAHTLRGDGFDASEDGTGRGTPIVPVSLCLTAHGGGRYDAESETLIPTNGGVFDVAPTLTRQFGEQSGQDHASGMLVSHAFGWQNAGAQGMAVTPFSPTLDKSKHPATVTFSDKATASRVRRLTPRECERLQGFPTIAQRLILDVCIDRRNHYATVALRCLRWQCSASPADGAGLTPYASSAAVDSNIAQASRAPLAALLVQPQSDGSVVLQSKVGRSSTDASGANGSGWCPPTTQNGSAAQLLVLPLQELAKATMAGKVASPLSTMLSTAAWNGGAPAQTFGGGIVANASDAMSGPNQATFTTSELGRLRPISDSTEATWCCSVLRAIAGSIPEQTLPDRFSLEATVASDYTLVPWRGGMASDGVRYKALGNSWAVNCARWVGQRIALVDQLNITRKAA